ncbi:MAG TPA: hypothetical protein VF702_07695 [Allosphingosinicella sp.]|jgi:hypothetical protein
MAVELAMRRTVLILAGTIYRRVSGLQRRRDAPRKLSIAFLLCCAPYQQAVGRIATFLPPVSGSDAAPRPTPPEAYLHEVDRQRARSIRSPGEAPCSRTGLDRGHWVTSSLPTDRCVRMLPRQRFRGIWFNRFEVSLFWPDRISIPGPEPAYWLTFERTRLSRLAGERYYLIEFEGRRTMFPGTYGYGPYEHEVIVDRLISVHAVPE